MYASKQKCQKVEVQVVFSVSLMFISTNKFWRWERKTTMYDV